MAVYHILSIVLVVMAVIAFLVCIKNRKRKDIKIPFDEDEKIKVEIVRVINVCEYWKRNNIIMLFLHYFLSIASLYCSLVTTYIASVNEKDSASVVFYSILALSFSSLELLAKPQKWGFGYRMAFEKLSIELDYYFSGKCKWCNVLNAVKKGEQIITQQFYYAESQGNTD